jgi:Single Cache domain 2
MLKFMKTGICVATVMISLAAFAQQPSQGTAEEAKSMLMKTVVAVKANKAKALDMIAKGEGGFVDRDLYPFCFDVADGKINPFANPNAKPLFGGDVRSLKDVTGKEFGKEQYAAAQRPEGQITEVSYMFAKPGSDPKPLPKVAFITRVGDLGCGVGYYK